MSTSPMHPFIRSFTSLILWSAGLSRPLRRWEQPFGIRIARDWYGEGRIGRVYHSGRSFMMGHLQDELTCRSFWFESYYEPHPIRCLLALDDLVDLFIDCNSHVGIYPLFAAAGGKEKRIYALEANPKRYTILSDNVRLNGLDIALDCAEFGTRESTAAQEEEGRAVGCRSTTLDAYFIGDGRMEEPVESGGVFLRLGEETDPVAILKGSRKFVARYLPTLMFQVGDGNDSYYDTLRSQGYRYFLMLPGGLLEVERPHAEELAGLQYRHVLATAQPAVIDRLVGPASRVDFSGIQLKYSSLFGMTGDLLHKK